MLHAHGVLRGLVPEPPEGPRARRCVPRSLVITPLPARPPCNPPCPRRGVLSFIIPPCLSGLLTEFFKHTDLCAACAISATAALEQKSKKMASTEEKLCDYIDQSGAWAPEENGIKTVRPWLGLGLVRVS